MSRIFAYDKTMAANIYDNNYTNDVREQKKQFYNRQKQKALNPTDGNIVTRYTKDILNAAPVLKYEGDIYNAPRTMFERKIITDTIGTSTTQNEFEKQFEICKLDASDNPICYNYTGLNSLAPDTMTTYELVEDKDFVFENMIPNTKRRDKVINDYNSTHSLQLANFTGVGLKAPKHENEWMFEKKYYENFNNNLNYDTDESRDRINHYIGLKQNNRKPFEPEQVSGGLGLDYTVQGLGGFRDTARVMPRTTDEMRAANNPKVSYVPNITPKGGIAMISTQEHIGEVRKYKPEKFAEYDKDTLWVGKAAYSGPLAKQTFIEKTTDRGNDFDRMGPAHYSNQYNINLEGKQTADKRDQLHQNGMPMGAAHGAIKRYTTGKDSSYTNYETQRATTSHNSHFFAGNGAQKHNSTRHIDVAKPTIKEETTEHFQTGFGSKIGQTYKQHTDNARTTIKETTSEYIQAGNGGNYGQTYQSNKDNARATTREDTSTNIQAGNGGNYGQTYQSNKDVARTTVREDTSAYIQAGNAGNYGQTYQKNKDVARTTIKEDTAAHMQTGMGGSIGQTYQKNKDVARSTIKEYTAEHMQAGNGGSIGQTYQSNKDVARTTIKETTAEHMQTGAGGSIGQTYQSNKDVARTTIKETTAEHMQTGAGGSIGQTYQSQKDDARATIKENTSTHIQTSAGGKTFKAYRTRTDVNNMISGDSRELATSRVPTWRGGYMVPTEKLVNTSLKSNPTFEPLLIPDKTGHVARANTEYTDKKNYNIQPSTIFDNDFVNIMSDIMANNPLINNNIHKANTSGYNEVQRIFYYTDQGGINHGYTSGRHEV